MVLLMENAKVSRCPPGPPQLFGKPAAGSPQPCQPSSSVCSLSLEKFHLKIEFVRSKIDYFLLFQIGTSNPIAKQFLFYTGHGSDALQKPRNQKITTGGLF